VGVNYHPVGTTIASNWIILRMKKFSNILVLINQYILCSKTFFGNGSEFKDNTKKIFVKFNSSEMPT